MADITKITATIKNADVPEAQTRNGTAYLGIAGREFVLKIADATDKQRGTTDTYVFGEDANVAEAQYNDPRSPQLTTADLDRYPVYIRFTGTDGWCIERVWVNVEPGGHGFDNLDLENVADNRRIWLRNDYGQALHLTRTKGTPDPSNGGGNGSEAETSGLKGVQLVWGDIDANGDVHSGSGNFYVFKDDTGRYRIEFQHPFAAVPSVTANIRGEGWRMLDNTHVNVIETGHTVITTGHDRGDWADRPFSFQVIGRGATRPTTPTPQPRVF